MGGKSGGGGHTPYEAPDNLKSAQQLRAIGIVSLGPIEGPVTANEYESCYFDNTPIQNSDKSWNFQNTKIKYALGTQDQLPLEGFEFSEREVPVGAEVKKDHPIVRSVIDRDVTRLRITVGVNALFHQNDQGDTYGSAVDLVFLINNQPVKTVKIEGKASSRFHRSYILENLPPVPFQLSVRRLTDDSKSQRLQNATFWSSYTEIIDTKLSYPNIALAGITTDSRYNPNFPNVNFLLRGRIIKVPSNYNPYTRVYDEGIWRGDFKLAWTNNPAWIFYDIAVNDLAGLGKRLGDYGVDKFQLYQIAKYCDELVPDGYGGMEPRMTANVWITERRDAYAVLSDMASVFRAITVWTGTQFTAIQDRPSDPVCTYTQANVIGGKFVRQYVPYKSIFTAVEVEYADKHNKYQRAIEYVADDELQKRYGYNVKRIVAFACTSRGQAHRYGEWILATSKLEQCTITFSVGRQGLLNLPGDIIEIADKKYADVNIGGRVLAINGKKVTLDTPIELSGESYLGYLVVDAEGVPKTQYRKIKKLDPNNAAIVELEELPENLAEMDSWALHSGIVKTQLYRVISIAENDDGSYTITALQHEPKKEAIVDKGARFDREPTTRHKGLSPVSNVDVSADSNGINLTFTTPFFTGQGLRYQVTLYRGGKFYQLFDDLKEPNLAFTGLPNGEYVAEIRAKNGHGQLSEPVSKSFSIQFAVSELVAVSKVFGIGLSWRNPIFANQNAAIEIWVSKENRFETARKLVSLAYPTNSYTYDGLGVAETYYFWARMVDNVNGTAGEFTPVTEGVTEASGEKIVDYIEGLLTKDSFPQQLLTELTQEVSTALGEDSPLAERVRELSNQIQQESQARVQALQQEAQTRGTQITNLEKVDQAQSQQLSQATAKAEQAIAGVEAERTARIEADRAESTARNTLTGRVANAESSLTTLQRTVTQQGLQISESSQRLNAKIDGIYKGRNLVLQSKAFLDNANVTLNSADYHRTKSFRVSSNVDWSSVRVLTLSCFIRHQENPRRVSIEREVNHRRIGAEIKVIYQDGSHQNFGCFRLLNMLKTAFDGVHHIMIRIPDGKIIRSVESCIIQIRQINGSPLYVGNPKLEIGDDATDWSPAPEDLGQAASDVLAELTSYKSAQAIKEQTQAQKMDSLTTRLGAAEGNISNIQDTKASKTEVASIARTALRSEWQSDAQALAESAKNQAITATDAKISTLASTVATNQEAMTASVNQLKASLGQASGANLLPNANFKKLSNNFPVGWGLYNNSGASQAASHIIVPGIDGSNAVKLTWSGVNSTTKGLYILHSNPSTFEVGQYYVLAVCARVPEGQPQDGRIALRYSNAPGWVDWRMVSQPTLSHQWQWTVMVARKPPHANGAYNQWYISVENYTGQAVELCLPYASKGETWLGYKAGDLSAEINDERQARVTSDTALSNRIDTITASVNDTKAQISSVSNVVAGVDGKVQAIHSLRTETIANGRKAIAGITLGSNGGEQSEIILMADKLQLVRNAQDGSPVPMFTVAQNRVAIRGDLIADHTILGRHLKANETITSPRINGGEIVGNNISGGVISGSTITGTTINGGTIRGAHIEGVTVKAENIIGDVMKAYSVTYRGNGYGNTKLTLTIPAFSKRRMAYLMPVILMSAGQKTIGAGERDEWQWSSSKYANVAIHLNGSRVISNQANGGNYSVALQGSFILSANINITLDIHINNYGGGLANGTQFVFFVGNG